MMKPKVKINFEEVSKLGTAGTFAVGNLMNTLW